MGPRFPEWAIVPKHFVLSKDPKVLELCVPCTYPLSAHFLTEGTAGVRRKLIGKLFTAEILCPDAGPEGIFPC